MNVITRPRSHDPIQVVTSPDGEDYYPIPRDVYSILLDRISQVSRLTLSISNMIEEKELNRTAWVAHELAYELATKMSELVGIEIACD